MKKLLLASLTCALAVSAGASAAPRNFDSNSLRTAPGASSTLSGDALARALALRAGQGFKTSIQNHGTLVNQVDAKMGVSTFVWAKPGAHSAVLGAVKGSQLAEAGGRRFLGDSSSSMHLSRDAIDQARLASVHDIGRGPIVARFKQTHDGVDVFNREINVLMTRDYNPVAASGYFATQPIASKASKGAAYSAAARYTPADGIAKAFNDLGGRTTSGALRADGQRGQTERYVATRQTGDLLMSGGQHSTKVWFPSADRLVAAWRIELSTVTRDGGNRYAYTYVVSAEDLSVLFRKNLTQNDAYTYRVFAARTGLKAPYDSPLGLDYQTPITEFDPNVTPPRNPVRSMLVMLAKGPIATNDPWLPPASTETVGNNVDAYVDLFGKPDEDPATDTGVYDPDLGDFRAVTTSPNTFDYRTQADSVPSVKRSQNAEIVNLFYIDNWLHDFWYGNGFDEAAGNAQMNNFRRGGEPGDPILAQGQDFGGRNNANMTTPPDGASPTQQMYLFDGPTTSSLGVSGTGTVETNTADYGPKNFTLTGELAAAVPNDACTALTNPGAVSGKIALVDRGTCTFKTKTKSAQNAGAIGVVLADNRPEPPPGLGDDSTITGVTIPTLSITQDDGVALRTQLASGPVTVTMNRTTGNDVDGGLDNGIVAHEFFHYVSNRLVGDGSGLGNTQGGGMGEGWSDTDSLILIVRAEDTAVPGNEKFGGAYNIGAYTGSPYFGIRRAPYSTDPSIFPMTFKHIEDGVPLPTTAPLAFGQDGSGNSEVHNVGEIWANTLWNVYVNLLDDPRYTFDQARERMKDYIILGLKMTPVNPTMLEARDGILAAAKATDQTDFENAAKAFAKMGMGVGAIAPDRFSDDNAGVVESFVALAGGFEVTAVSLTADGCDADGVLDAGEDAQLSITIHSNGTEDLGRRARVRVASNDDFTFPGGSTIKFPRVDADGMASVTVPVHLDSATTAAVLTLKVTFPDVGGGADVVIEPPGGTVDFFANYDLTPNATSDDMENSPASLGDWKTLAAGGAGWQLDGGAFDSFFGQGQMWFGPDNSSASEVVLQSPVVAVGARPFRLAFGSFYSFEFAGTTSGGTRVGFDGAVLQVSVDGAAFVDVTQAGGTFSQGGYDGVFLALDPDNGTPGFVGSNNGFKRTMLDFGHNLQGHDVRFRWIVFSDSNVGDFGWLVDNVRMINATNLPFSKVVDDAGTCIGG